MHIGQIIYALRREKGLTQEALALAAETATSNLSRIEKASAALPERYWNGSPQRWRPV